MDRISILLIVMHVVIAVFIHYQFHPHLSLTDSKFNREQQISAAVGYSNDLLRVSLYHCVSIMGIWYSRRYGAGLVRASGFLLIGELLKSVTAVIQHAVEAHHLSAVEILVEIGAVCLFLVATMLTFTFAGKLAQRENDIMRSELITTSVGDESMNSGGHFSLA